MIITIHKSFEMPLYHQNSQMQRSSVDIESSLKEGVSPANTTKFVDFINLLNHRKVQDLKKIRNHLGVFVHQTLIEKFTQAQEAHTLPPKLLLINTSAAGKDTHSIASNDGSSKYLAGGLTNYSETPSKGYINFDPAAKIQETFAFWEKGGIKDITLIAGGEGYASGEHVGKFKIYAGSRQTVLYEDISAIADEVQGSKEHRQAMQEISAIATFGLILQLNEIPFSVLCEKVKELEGALIAIKDPLLIKANEIEEFNEKIWQELAPLLEMISEEHPNQKLSIGESFTSGILASLMTSQEGASKIFDISLNWYSPQLKEFVGVPKRNVQEDLIAEPETIALATKGLLNIAPPTTGIALGTTGWANYWVEGKPDYFSIGIAAKDIKDSKKTHVLTAKVIVTASQNASPSKGRRQLTRHLGATTALYMLTSFLSKQHPPIKQFAILSRTLLNAIEDNGKIDEISS